MEGMMIRNTYYIIPNTNLNMYSIMIALLYFHPSQ